MRMRILLMISILVQALAAKIVNLGIVANTYPVKEKSIKVSIKEGVADLNVTKLKKDIRGSVEELIKAKYALPMSMSEEHYTRQNIYTVPMNIVGPEGKVVYKKGERMSVPMPGATEMSLCFVDARYPKLLPLIADRFGKCIYMIANNRLDGSYPSLLRNSIDGRLYPVTDLYVKRFGIKVFPTKIRLHGSKIDYMILNMKKMMKEAGIKK
jgi:hypothetical protein